jgi:hypothetical protein
MTSRPTDVPPPNRVSLPRWFAPAVVIGAVLFLPWIGYLAVQLPDHARSAHYGLMWVGFDLMMWAVLVALAAAAIRRTNAVEPLGVCAATFMLVDAWFDVTSADSRSRLVGALLSAFLVELPAATVCLWIAANAARVRNRAYRRLFRRELQRPAGRAEAPPAEEGR